MRSRLTPRTLIDYRSPYCSRALFFVRSSARVLHDGGCARPSSRTIIVCTSSCFALIGPVACIRRGWLPVKRAYYQGRLQARHLAHQDTGVIRDRTHSAACFPPQKAYHREFCQARNRSLRPITTDWVCMGSSSHPCASDWCNIVEWTDLQVCDTTKHVCNSKIHGPFILDPFLRGCAYTMYARNLTRGIISSNVEDRAAKRLPQTTSAASHRAKHCPGPLAVMNPAAYPRDNRIQPLPQRWLRRVTDAQSLPVGHRNVRFTTSHKRYMLNRSSKCASQ